jgi:hypothetical protein
VAQFGHSHRNLRLREQASILLAAFATDYVVILEFLWDPRRDDRYERSAYGPARYRQLAAVTRDG